MSEATISDTEAARLLRERDERLASTRMGSLEGRAVLARERLADAMARIAAVLERRERQDAGKQEAGPL